MFEIQTEDVILYKMKRTRVYPRNIAPSLIEALSDTPVVVVHGARQVGKSTLMRALAEGDYPAQYVSLDQAVTLQAARSDPEGFLQGFDGPVVIDEVQRVPELLLAIKAEVDRNRRPGRFLLTGSANILQMPRLADALTGRMQILTLWPLSQGELTRRCEGFIDALFGHESPVSSPMQQSWGRLPTRAELVRMAATGGYPEAVARRDNARRREWFASYLETVLARDVRDLANIAGLADLPLLLSAVAERACGLLNYAELGRDVGLNQMTLKRYLALLQATFLVRTVRPWFSGRAKRLLKSQKLYLGDCGLLAHLLDLSPEPATVDPKRMGKLLENFAALEIMKQASWSRLRPEVLHFRDYEGSEVDVVLEARGGQKLAGIEIKSSARLDASDFKGLRALAEAAAERFCRGVVLYTGQEIVPFGRNLYAMPMAALWRWGAEELRQKKRRARQGRREHQ